jgi:hypothetical protein
MDWSTHLQFIYGTKSETAPQKRRNRQCGDQKRSQTEILNVTRIIKLICTIFNEGSIA